MLDPKLRTKAERDAPYYQRYMDALVRGCVETPNDSGAVNQIVYIAGELDGKEKSRPTGKRAGSGYVNPARAEGRPRGCPARPGAMYGAYKRRLPEVVHPIRAPRWTAAPQVMLNRRGHASGHQEALAGA